MSFLHRDLDVLLPDIDYVEIPVDWWNADADKSLLIGVFKHGISFIQVFMQSCCVRFCLGTTTRIGEGGGLLEFNFISHPFVSQFFFLKNI